MPRSTGTGRGEVGADHRKSMSPTQRTLKYLRDRGYTAEKVEQRLPIPGKFITRDFLGFIDYIAIRPGSDETVGVQITSASNVSAHLKKIKALPTFTLWAATPSRVLEVHGWDGKRLRLLSTRSPKRQQEALYADSAWLVVTKERRRREAQEKRKNKGLA
jgi:hypothetical protein